mgnify:CR=1 FL=1
MKPFIPALFPSTATEEPAWWFLFQNGKLLVHPNGDHVDVPCIKTPADLGIPIDEKLFLGTLDSVPCFGAAVEKSANLPASLDAQTIRFLNGRIDTDLFWTAAVAGQYVHWSLTHRYCGRCGAKTVDKTDERAKICPDCGLVNYPRVSPAVIVAVTRGRQILLGRSPRFPTGMYSVLAGFVEPGETLEDCVRREIREEVNISVKNIRYFDSQPWPFPNSLMVGFTAEYAGGDIRVDNTEIEDADWYDVDALPRLPDKISISRRLIDGFIERCGG